MLLRGVLAVSRAATAHLFRGELSRLVFLAVALFVPFVAASQPAFTCQTDSFGDVCRYPPAIQYGVFGPTTRAFGNSRDEACLRWAAVTPDPTRRSYVRVAAYDSGVVYCVFEFEFPQLPGQLVEGIQGDNREIKVCSVNSVMYNAAGQYWHDNWIRAGALFMTWPVGAPMPDSSALYPSSVMAIALTSAGYENAMCASRGVPIPTRNHGHPNGQSDASSCSASVGNPINIGAGLKSQTEFDYDRAGKLRFVRSYNSGAGTNYFNGPLGKGWQHNYAVRLSIANVVTAFRGDGRIVEFAQSGGAWTHWPDVNDQLIELRDPSNIRTGWKYLSATNDVELYDANGTLLSITSSIGTTATLTYADGTASGDRGGVIEGTSTPLPRSLLLRATDTFGVSLSFGYNADYWLIRVTRPDGNAHRFSYTASNLTSVVYPDQSGDKTRTYVYENPTFTSALTGIVDEKNDHHSTYGYDQFGRAVTTELALNANRYGLTFNADGTTAVADPIGSTRTYGFNNQFGLVRVASQSQLAGSGCGPSSSAMTYDANGNVSSRTDFNNNKICYAYDLTRNVETKRIEGLVAAENCTTALSSPPATARVITSQWHPDWRLVTRVAEPKKVITTVYNGQGATCAPAAALVDGRPIAVVCTRTEQATTDETGAAGFSAATIGTPRTWSYTYTTYGRVLTATDPNNKTTVTTYHPDNDPDLGKRGNIATVTNAANHITTITDYNAHGQPTRSVDPNGVVTMLTYDPRMRLTSRTVGSEATVFGYDPVGQMTSVNLPDNASLTYTYDAAHRLTAINDQKGNRIDYTLDAMGNRTAEQIRDAGGALAKNIARAIDALNRVQQVTGAAQ